MITPALESKNYYNEALGWITENFKDKEIFKRYLQVLFLQQDSVFKEINNLLQNRSLDTAQGKQLDVIGAIVGQPRSQAQAALYTFFGFLEDITAETFGDLNDSSLGGYWYSQGQPIGGNVTLSDDDYRRLIKARIIKNSSSATVDQFLIFMDQVFGDGTSGSSGAFVETHSSTWFAFDGFPNGSGYTDGLLAGGLYWNGIGSLVPTGRPVVEVYFSRPITLLEVWMLHAQIPDKNGRFSPFMLKPLGVELIFYDLNGNVINPV